MNTKIFCPAVIAMLSLLISTTAMAQSNKIYRIAKIQVDPAQLAQYKAALKEQMATAIKAEPGVLSYYALSDKKNESQITIFECYADSTAYNSHIQTAHFKKYKETVQQMVKSLEITDVDVIGSAKKPGM